MRCSTSANIGDTVTVSGVLPLWLTWMLSTSTTITVVIAYPPPGERNNQERCIFVDSIQVNHIVRTPDASNSGRVLISTGPCKNGSTQSEWFEFSMSKGGVDSPELSFAVKRDIGHIQLLCVQMEKNGESSHVLTIFDEEAQAIQSARNSSRMLEESYATGVAILSQYASQRNRLKVSVLRQLLYMDACKHIYM
ncbi:hypothetical protein RHGRI_017959 [Rhododendron griersonianum]|uniref:Uncharacterized protein n=1 Tax=Rhododendron griersonianum TaxID=479676 RepID=A0AAV6JZP3_9ERIC|nr:hypothetical protein RHGRI_017959 [Rhododendron griersonianum]